MVDFGWDKLIFSRVKVCAAVMYGPNGSEMVANRIGNECKLYVMEDLNGSVS